MRIRSWGIRFQLRIPTSRASVRGRHGFQSKTNRRRPPDIRCALRPSTRCPLEELPKPLEELPTGDQNSAFVQPCPREGINGRWTVSRNLPAVTASTMLLSRSISSSVDSAQASQPQTGKSSVCHRPKRTCRPGKAVNATAMGAASGSMGLSLTHGTGKDEALLQFLVEAVPFCTLDLETFLQPVDNLQHGGMQGSKALDVRQAAVCLFRRTSGPPTTSLRQFSEVTSH